MVLYIQDWSKSVVIKFPSAIFSKALISDKKLPQYPIDIDYSRDFGHMPFHI